jgi:hypothetical protein
MIDSYNKDYSKKRGIFGLLIKTPEFNDQNVKKNYFKYIKSINNFFIINKESSTFENDMAILKAKEFNDKLIKSIEKFEANKIKNIQVSN